MSFYATLDSQNIFKVLSFSTPILNDDNKIISWSASTYLEGGQYDPQTKVLFSLSKGRALGDIFVSAQYQAFGDYSFDGFMITKYEVDNTENENEDENNEKDVKVIFQKN